MDFEMRTTIINRSPHDVSLCEGYGGIIRLVQLLRSNEGYTYILDPNETYREYRIGDPNETYLQHLIMRRSDGKGTPIFFSYDDLEDYKELVVYETQEEITYRVSKIRASSTRKPQDLGDFIAATKEFSSKMKTVKASTERMVELWKGVKICPSQCKNLVQTCVAKTEMMRMLAMAIESDSDLWDLYVANNLRHLISSLDRLLATLGSIKELLQACGSQWGWMGLVLSMPLPPVEKRTSSKFDLLINELIWNHETIQYALHSTREMRFMWYESQSRFVLEGNHMAMEPVDSNALILEDRRHLQSCLEDGSILVPESFFLQFARQHLYYKYSANQLGPAFVDVLKKRLLFPILPNESSLVPEGFWINHEDLKLGNKLGNKHGSHLKSILKGEWCGMSVAIGITYHTTKEAIEREAMVMLKVQHPNIVGFLGCAFTDDAPSPVSGGRDDKCTAGYLVMELMQKDLRRVIERRVRIQSGGPFPLVVAIDILLQIVGAMIHMHNRDIMHRDLKAANCVASLRSFGSQSLDFYTVKLIDFGTSKELDPDAVICDHTANSGTRRWMAPEVWGIKSKSEGGLERPLVPYTRSADVWSFGMTCYEVITGLLPFHHECVSNTDLMKALLKGKRPVVPTAVSCPEGLKELMSRCWAQESSARPDFKDILKALWTLKYELELQ